MLWIIDHIGWIIPAYAGSTKGESTYTDPDGGSSPHTRGARGRTPWGTWRRRDHPRIRGEHLG